MDVLNRCVIYKQSAALNVEGMRDSVCDAGDARDLRSTEWTLVKSLFAGAGREKASL